MVKIEFDFGVGVTGDGVTINPAWAERATQDLLNFASAQAGGCSLIARQGAWMDRWGLIVEPGYTLVVLVVSDECISAIVAFIKTTFQQKAVFVTKTNVNAQLY